MDWTLEVIVLPVSDIDRSIEIIRERVDAFGVSEPEIAPLGNDGIQDAGEIMVIDPRDGGTFFGFSDPDGNSWAVQELKVRAESPLIPAEARGRFGDAG